MGDHSRSRTAADNVGGFRNSENVFADPAPGTPGQSRLGVKGATVAVHNPDGTSKGGLAPHAINNSNFFTDFVDPWTGVARDQPEPDHDLLTVDNAPECMDIGTNFIPQP
jgi:hypothetical protein